MSATLFIEIPDLAELRWRLPILIGLDEHLWLTVGGSRVQALSEAGRSTEDKSAPSTTSASS